MENVVKCAYIYMTCVRYFDVWSTNA